MAEHKKRRHLQSMSLSANLNEDLVVEIMLRVAAKSLLRFKSLSKQWKSIIEDPTFITLHHKHAHSRPDGGSLLICAPLIPKRRYHELQLFTAPYHGSQARQLRILPTLKGYNASPSTHGLVLLSPKGRVIPHSPLFVLNPTIRELIPLPRLENYLNDEQLRKESHEEDSDIHTHLWVSYSLGFDPSTGLYKILSTCAAIKYLCNRNRSLFLEKLGCNMYVFTLGGKDWRKLDSTANQVIAADEMDPKHSCCANGAIYCKTSHNSIAAFGVREEKFFLVAPPPRAAPSYKIMELGGSLALRENRHLVWILEDQSWILLELEMPYGWRGYAIVGDYTIAGGIQSINRFLLAQQFQILKKYPCVYYCDKSGKRWSRFQITGLPDLKLRKYGFLTSNHVETLFSSNASLH